MEMSGARKARYTYADYIVRTLCRRRFRYTPTQSRLCTGESYFHRPGSKSAKKLISASIIRVPWGTFPRPPPRETILDPRSDVQKGGVYFVSGPAEMFCPLPAERQC